MSAPSAAGAPRWFNEIDTCISISPQFLVTGNIDDVYLVPDPAGKVKPVGLTEALWRALARSGFDSLAVVDPVSHVTTYPEGADADWLPPHARSGYLDEVAAVATAVATNRERRVALLVRFASRLVTQLNALSDAERDFFVRMQKLATEAARHPESPERPRAVFNAIFWAVERDRDLPAFFSAAQAVRVVSIPHPNVTARREIARRTLAAAPEFPTLDAAAQQDAVERLADQSSGLRLREVQAAGLLVRDQNIPLSQVTDAVRTVKLGVRENPWREAHDRIANARRDLAARVKGQPKAIAHAADILMRSAAGLTGAHVGRDPQRPRGVLFLAGPTGVGKTELAKALTMLVFGDETAYTRFDMSEFAAEQAGERLAGAPPGYIGFDAGGELTNAVRERPFSLLLFDEIEKAHPRVLDKFLQILEDGRLTDGTGSTVHFTECIIVFTSNLGTFRTVVEGNKTVRVPNPDAAYGKDPAEVESAIRHAIEEHFRLGLQRPELYNRLGDNIVVFDYITDETAGEILDQMLTSVARQTEREHGLTVTVAPETRRTVLDEWRTRPELGGRGVGSAVESAVINPLSRFVFDREPNPGTQVVLRRLRQEQGMWIAEWHEP